MPQLVDRTTIELGTIKAPPRAQAAAALAILLAALAVTLPIRGWLSASNPLERVNMATVAEMWQTGHWFYPTLNAQPRLAKPPLAAWVSALATRRLTITQMSDADAAIRHAALLRLLTDVRIPAVIAAALMLIAILDLGVTLGNLRLGILSALIAATTLMFLRQAQVASSDVYLALFVTAANALLARLVLGRATSWTWLAPGAALGLAIMCKGPVSLVETVLPIGLFLLWHRRQPRPPFAWKKFAAGALVMLIIGGWWFALAAARFGHDALNTWFVEIFRYQTNTWQADPWYHYLVALRLFLPWLPWLLVGLWNAAFIARNDRRRWLPILLLIVPILILSFFHERRDRYLLPMLAPAAVIMARGLIDWMNDPKRRGVGGTALLWLHGSLLMAGAIAVALSLMHHHRPAPAAMAATAAIFLVAALIQTPRHPRILAPITVIVVIALNALFLPTQEQGIPQTLASRMAEIIQEERLPGDVYVVYPAPTTMYLPAADLSLWLGRPVRLTRHWPQGEFPTLAYAERELEASFPIPQPAAFWTPVGSLQGGAYRCVLYSRRVSAQPGAARP